MVSTSGFYKIKDLPKYENGQLTAAGSIVATSVLSAFNGFLIDKFFGNALATNPVTGIAVGTFKALLGSTVTSAQTYTFDIQIDHTKNLVSYNNGSTWENISLVGGQISANAAQFIFQTALQKVVASGAGALFPFWGVELLPAIGVTAAYSTAQYILNSEINNFINGYYGLLPMDVKYFDKSNQHTQGVFNPSGISTPKLSVEQLINNSPDDLAGGHISFYLKGETKVGDSYNIYESSAFGKVAAALGVTLDQFLATGPSGAEKNISHYAKNLSNVGYVYNIPGHEMSFYIKETINGHDQILTANNIYYADASDHLTLKLGDGDYVVGNQVQLIVPESATVKTIHGDANDPNIILGNNAGDTIYGGSQNDTIVGGTGKDAYYGGAGDDFFLPTNMSTADIYGGAGIDTVDFSRQQNAVTFSLGSAYHEIENVVGSKFADKLTGTIGDETIIGGAGNDTIDGGYGSDTLMGGVGNDVYIFHAKNSYTVPTNLAGIDTILDTDGKFSIDLGNSSLKYAEITENSAFYTVFGWPVPVSELHNVDGYPQLVLDWVGVSLDKATNYVQIWFPETTYAGGGNANNFILIPNVGSNFSINLHDGILDVSFTPLANVVDSTTGDDFLSGTDGNDSIAAQAGNDTVAGSAGNDTIDGGTGIDLVDYTNSSSAVSVNLASTAAQSGGDAAGDVLTNIEGTTGSAYNDSLTGNALANQFYAGAGNDTITGGAGADMIDGGLGINTASYAASAAAISLNLGKITAQSGGDAAGDILTNINNITATAFNDSLVGNSANNAINGLAGNDTLIGGAGADVLDGGANIDTASYATSAAAVTLNLNLTTAQAGGDAAGDILKNIENITGSNFNDSLTGNAVANIIYGGSGNDAIAGNGGADRLDGGTGTDMVSYIASATAVNVNLALATAQSGGDAAGDILSNFEGITGSSYNDTLTGSVGNDSLAGGAGNDSLTGAAGNDTLSASNGNDTLFGGEGNDLLYGGNGSDYIDGGAGVDTLSYSTSSTWVSSDLGANNHWNGDAAWDNVVNVENLIGSAFNDYLTGNAGNNNIAGGDGNDSLTGGVGNDTLSGGNGADTLIGGDGNDVLIGNAGSDYIDGGAGSDTISYASSAAWVNVDLGINNHWNGDAAWDNVLNVENIIGSNFNDQLLGNAGANNINGGAGNDLITGNAGADTLTGGAGNDIFIFKAISQSATAAPDMIMDFLHGADRMDVRGLGFTGIVSGAAVGASLGYSYNVALDQTTIASTSGLKIVLVGHPTINETDFLFA